MGREDGKLKLARRKPLRDVSNRCVKSSKSAKNKAEMPPPDDADRVDEDPLDRILFLHSDISSIVRQIDELVVQAVNVKPSDNKVNKEIKSFADLLSDIHSSLKPWVTRLQKALASCSTQPKIQLGETAGGAHTLSDEDEAVHTPMLSKHESLVSPSPLVSWRATDCTIERGKQLFLLTPLPRPKTVMSKAPASPKPTVCEDTSLSSTAPVSLHGVEAGQQNHVITEAVAKNVESAKELDFASPPHISLGDFSLLVTPSLKNPPRSCVLLEPDYEYKSRKIGKCHKSTPFPVGSKMDESTDYENSGNEVSENMGLKYPELIGIKPFCMLKNGIKALVASPAWIVSPPKCCTLLEPPHDNLSKDDASLDCHSQELDATFDQKICLAPKEGSIQLNEQVQGNSKVSCRGNFRGNLVTVENTPLWKEAESTVHRGKRPGENTLKKELWTKFEAASMSGFRLNFCAPQDTSELGFLDRLEEASCEEMGLYPDSLR
ncbi:hypothetical protein Cgig2_015791 [Carnegiea gigantea]|uniref:Uncharacterized protein n=1 Tax=Carnegiea gigantea TaxID=171969 RepID=A0A9Q1QKC2_9CARY|nr:hypothetical protein Cgig2_015791 [Carnegiea gigantea]